MFNEELCKIGLRRKSILFYPMKKIDNNDFLTLNNKTLLYALMKEIENLGFMFDKALYEKLQSISNGDLKIIYHFLIKNLCELKGKTDYKPFYPNFPQQVAEATDYDLFFNCIVHYWTFGKWKPEYSTALREKLKGDYKLDIIYLGCDNDFIDIGQNLFKSKLSYSNTDKKDLSIIIKTYSSSLKLPKKITNKENLIFIIEEYRKNGLDLSSLFKTATDVLRYAIALQDGDTSLSEPHKFTSISRQNRRFLLELLNNIHNPLEDMYRHRTKWIRLTEKLHPYDYKNKYKEAFANICYIRNNTRYKESFNHYVHKYLNNKDYDKLCQHLQQRPSEFARRLNEALQYADDVNKELIIQSFEKICYKVSSNVLISVFIFFTNINNLTNRFFVIKGLSSKTYGIENNISVDQIYVDKILRICTSGLLDNFKNKEKIGKVFIDNSTKKINIPNQTRTASSAFKQLTKGSRIKLDDDKDIIRMFCYWKNQEERVIDIDLSSVFFKENFVEMQHISYTNLRGSKNNDNQKYFAIHSGDIVDAPNGASEYIDLSISDAIKCGFKYVVTTVNVYSGTSFSNMEVCGAGFMQREDKQSGNIYDPLTVKAHFKVQADGRVSCPFILDLENREMIWVDTSLRGKVYCNAVENNADKQGLVAKNIIEKNDMSLYDLIKLNCEARAELYYSGNVVDNNVFNKDILDCDIIYTVDKSIVIEELRKKLTVDEIGKKKIVTVYDIDVLLGDLM